MNTQGAPYNIAISEERIERVALRLIAASPNACDNRQRRTIFSSTHVWDLLRFPCKLEVTPSQPNSNSECAYSDEDSVVARMESIDEWTSAISSPIVSFQHQSVPCFPILPCVADRSIILYSGIDH